MAAEKRITMVAACCLILSLSGCALLQKKPATEAAPMTQEELAWWEANKHRKTYIPGRGYYVEGTNGFFDERGRKLSTDLVKGGVEEKTESFLDKIAPKRTYANFMKAIGQGPNEGLARKWLEEGDAMFRQKQFADAAKKYRKAHKRWPDSPLEEEALYKSAESHFFADQYPKADDGYALLIKKFPSTQYVSQVVIRRFAIGRYWEQHDTTHPHWPVTPNLVDKTRPMFDTGGHAIRVYERIRLDDPTGPLADDSIMASANAYFLKGRWEDADYHYGLLRSEYPKSEHQYQAHLLGLRCKLLRYQGPGYEGTPLDEAEEIATQLLTQFGPELAGTREGERERVAQVRAGIRAQRAQREWDMAEYYAKGKHYGSSKLFYEKIADDYSETQLAEQARAKIEETKDLPAHPTPPFQWLVDLLPASTREGPVLPKSVTATNTIATGNKSTVTR